MSQNTKIQEKKNLKNLFLVLLALSFHLMLKFLIAWGFPQPWISLPTNSLPFIFYVNQILRLCKDKDATPENTVGKKTVDTTALWHGGFETWLTTQQTMRRKVLLDLGKSTWCAVEVWYSHRLSFHASFELQSALCGDKYINLNLSKWNLGVCIFTASLWRPQREHGQAGWFQRTWNQFYPNT